MFLEKDIEDENLGLHLKTRGRCSAPLKRWQKESIPFILEFFPFRFVYYASDGTGGIRSFLITLTLSLLFARQVNYFNVRASGAWNWFKKFLVFL
ncbi:MAG: hypothetical protein HWD61_04540 [Parachlamydiaceae bacterium]|nr:MAG: hypothetical protein HWD61_04540 [Parachlamydiaceae bacterium]